MSFQSDPDDSRSTYGIPFTLNEGVSWKSPKQPTITNSMTKTKYIAANEISKETFRLKKFITDLGIVPLILDPIPLLCDNIGAIA